MARVKQIARKGFAPRKSFGGAKAVKKMAAGGVEIKKKRRYRPGRFLRYPKLKYKN